MKKFKLSEAARQAKNAYQREYRRKNPDKIRQYTVNFWERKARFNGETMEEKIIRFHNEGFSLRDIAAKVGINHVRVSRIIKSM